jgi:uncharacterized protein
MAKQGYPGLVLVPPSDRWLIRRRLARWALPIIVVVWGASTSSVWLPSSDNHGNCQMGNEQEIPADFQKECDQSGQSETAAQSRLDEFPVVRTSQGRSQTGSRSSTSSHDTGRLAIQDGAEKTSMPHRNGSAGLSSDRAMSPPSKNRSTASRTIKKPASNPNLDARLAKQGDAFAQYRLGRFYAQLGGPHAPESVSWYVKASGGLQRLAEAGNGEAMYVLGVMYAFGRGVAKDREQARLWLTQAVDQQVSAAYPVLARLDKH